MRKKMAVNITATALWKEADHGDLTGGEAKRAGDECTSVEQANAKHQTRVGASGQAEALLKNPTVFQILSSA
jgi:hypothetical protein